MAHFSKITILNHTFNGMSHRLNVSEVLYRSAEGKSILARDMNAIGIVADYALNGGIETIKEVVSDYKNIFPELAEKISKSTLTENNVRDSKFAELSEMIQAPYVLYGLEGAEETIFNIITNKPFTIKDMLNTKCRKKSVNYLRKTWTQLNQALKDEMERFENEKKDMGKLIIYFPESSLDEFTKILSNKISMNNPNKVIAIKKETESGFNYILRKRGLKASLPKIINEMGISAINGIERVLKVNVEDPEAFEEELSTRLS